MILKDPETNDTRLSDEPMDGWEEITLQEFEAICESRRVAPAPLTPLDQIVAIEVANPVTHRMLRELTLSVAHITSVVTGRAPEEIKVLRDMQALEEEIEGLRQQAKAEGLIP